MIPVAFLFPGQGSQFPGMGKDICEKFPEAKRVYERADDALSSFGISVSHLSFEGTEEQLKQTAVTQPVILTHSVAVFEVLKARGFLPAFAAGHSLGEYSALVAAGSLSLEEALVLVRRRGQFMQEAVPVGVGAMAAAVGLTGEEVAAACAEAAREDDVCQAANFNSPEQTVIAGTAAAVSRATEILKARGAKRVLPLAVSAPFHCELMKPAEDKLWPFLEKGAFLPLEFPVYTNVDARQNTDGATAREALRRQICSPVRWVEIVQDLSRQVSWAVEVGPGSVLSGLAKRTAKGWTVKTTSNAESLEALMAEIQSK